MSRFRFRFRLCARVASPPPSDARAISLHRRSFGSSCTTARGMYIFGESYVKYSYYAYSKPYCRVPAYLVGMAFGGFVNESWASDPSKVPDFSRSQGASFLAAAFVALLACVFAPLSDYRDPESWPPWGERRVPIPRPTDVGGGARRPHDVVRARAHADVERVPRRARVDAVRAADVRRVPVPPGRDQVVRGHRDGRRITSRSTTS